MTMSNFPAGFKNGVSIRGIPLSMTHPGKVFWVSNATTMITNQKGGSNSNDGSFNAPFSTIDYAVGQCVANRGDVIMVKPGHAESISSATTLVLDVAGIALIGMGRGRKRPTLTFTTATTANIPVSANDILVHNILFVANFADVAAYFTLTTAGDFHVDSCEFRDTSAILNCLKVILTTVSVDSDGLTFTNNRVLSLGTTAATTVITIAATTSRVKINDNWVVMAVLNNTAALLEHGALNVTDLEMGNNRVYRPNTDTATGAILIKTTATVNTGMAYNNYVGCLDAAGILLFTSGSDYAPIQNFVTGAANASGFLLPAADTDA